MTAPRESDERTAVESLPGPAELAAAASVDLDAGRVFIFPTSPAQRRLWFLDRLEPGSPVYNIPLTLELAGALCPAALAAALTRIVARHEALATTFEAAERGPVQVISPPRPVPLPIVDLTALALSDGAADSARQRAEALRLVRQEASLPFDLELGPLLRGALIRSAPARHLLLLSLHHIVADGWSVDVLWRELSVLYETALDGTPSPLPELPIQYVDYTVWLDERLDAQRLAELRGFWRGELDGAPELLALPIAKPRPAQLDRRGGSRSQRLAPEIRPRLERLGRELGVTPFMVLLGAFATLLSRLGEQTDVVIGGPAANRDAEETHGLIGLFVNMLPLRVDLSGRPTLGELLTRIRRRSTAAYAHQELSFDQIVEAVQPGRNESYTPLVQVVLMLQEPSQGAPCLPGVDCSKLAADRLESGNRTVKFDLLLTFEPTDRSSLEVTADYRVALFEPTAITRLLDSLATLLGAALDSPDRSVADLPLLPAAARHQLLAEWNDTAGPLPERTCLHEAFELQARLRPQATAIVFEGREIAYGELNERANRLAHHLIDQGVGPNALVGVHLTRRPAMIEAVLAVLKAGGAYVPLEASWPPERAHWVLRQNRIGHLITELSQLGVLSFVEPLPDLSDVVCLDRIPGVEPVDRADRAADGPAPAPRRRILAGGARLWSRVDLDDRPAGDPPPVAGAGDLAYIIFTSGSTGHPKGVVVRHRPAVHLVEWVNRTFEVGPDDRLLFVTALSFDLSVYDVFGILAAGGTIRLASSEELAEPQELVRILLREPVTFWDSAPAALLQCTPYFPAAGETESALRLVFLSGDWIPVPLPDRVRDSFAGARVISLGGATEATVWSNVYPIGEVDPGWPSVPYGRPIDNAVYHVLDARFEPCPIGVPGDLYIGGICLSTGYARAPRQTAASYRPDPFDPGSGDESGARLYRTGDRARYLADGNLEFLGRLDTQVKVRGYRIELGEIEAVLAAHPAVAEAVVLAREDKPGDQRLVAYYLSKASEPPPDEASLRRQVQAKLPVYMMPKAFVRLDRWPLSPTGKLDRKALPAPEIAATEAPVRGNGAELPLSSGRGSHGIEPDPPRGPVAGSRTPASAPSADRRAASAPGAAELAEQIAAIWREELGLESVGLGDNFFDLGGHSLLLTQVHARLQKALGRDLPMVELFRHPTVGSLAEHLGDAVAPPPSRTAEPVRETQRSVATESAGRAAGGAIAIVGMAGRFPQAENLTAFWRLIAAGGDAVRRFSDEELLAAGVPAEYLEMPDYVKARAALDDHQLFDAGFFELTRREAQILDPQQRLFLEVAWHALEDAAIAPREAAPPGSSPSGASQGGWPGRIGVFAGVSENSYGQRLLNDPEMIRAVGHYQLALSNLADYVATRLSYKLDLSGPSLNVQTACSTSLVAVHLAVRALESGDCDVALAGGASVMDREIQGYFFLDGGIDSPDGSTRTFDAQARGTVRGSGVGVVVLKRLADALADGDPIRAVVRGSAINNDGSRKIGFTAPGVDGQARAVRDALAAAGVDPRTVGYIEAHGTATPMGDPIEVAALSQAFRSADRDPANGDETLGLRLGVEPGCALGSVKSNVGHLDAAAGITGLIKTALALENRQIPPTLHFQELNPEIDLEHTPFYVNTDLVHWPGAGGPRRAGVSSFGIGGTNAHAVLEEAPRREPSGDTRPAQLLLLSARDEAALAAATENLARYLDDRRADLGPRDLADVAHTLQVGRRGFTHRRAVVSRDAAEAVDRLRSGDRRSTATGLAASPPPAVTFLFPGQGAQHPGMGGDLYATEAGYRRTVDRCCALLRPELGLDLRDLLYPPAGEPNAMAEAARRLAETQITQPALFVAEYALVALLAEWGIRPRAMLGHSIGEYVAACIAGVFSLEDALRLLAARGRRMAALPAGSMLAVALGPAELEEELAGAPALALAAVNAPASSVVSGDPSAVDRLARRLAERGVGTQRLRTSHAFHSPSTQPALGPFQREVAALDLQPPSIPFVSNVTGTWITDEEATDPAYWARHLRSTVRFSDGVETLLATSGRAFLEVGPGRGLTTLLRRHAASREAALVHPAMRPQKDAAGSDVEALLDAVGRMWTVGVAVDWRALSAHERRHRISLPLYPFQRQRYWIEEQGGAKPSPASASDLAELAPDPAASEPQAAGEPGSPRTASERAIAAAWRDLLGVEELRRDDDFFDLGGSSLMGLQLNLRLRRDLGVSLPGSALLEAPTLAELAALADSLGSGGAGDGATPARPAKPRSCLVRIQAGDGGRPRLFLVHQVGGQVYTFRALAAELGRDQPVYALRSHGLEDGEEPFISIEAMAEHYLPLIREEQPEGPYWIGGASMGGMIAFEMAHRLAAAGEGVELLTLMDTPCLDQMPAREDNAEPLSVVIHDRTGLTLDAEEVRRRGPDEAFAYALAEVDGAGLSERLDADEARRWTRVLEANVEALYSYQPRPYPGRLLFFRAEDRRPVDPPRPELPWIELARGGVETILVPGDHETMHQPPQVEAMARALRSRLGARLAVAVSAE